MGRERILVGLVTQKGPFCAAPGRPEQGAAGGGGGLTAHVPDAAVWTRHRLVVWAAPAARMARGWRVGT